MKLKLKIPDKLATLCKSALNQSKKCIDSAAFEYTVAIALILTLAFGSLKLPDLHNQYLRQHVGSKVYTIRDSLKSGGGTGFAVKAPSGESYILTNDHVCNVSSDKQTVLVSSEDGANLRRRIIAHDEDSDLCLVEGMPGVEGLKVAKSDPLRGETLNVIGHPRLMPLHLSTGELTGKETIQFVMGPISFIDPESGEEKAIPPESGGFPAERCNLAKNKQIVQDVDLGFFVLKVKFCVVEVKDAYISSAIVHPGNSGSPVTDFWGNVEGVVFASDSTNWARMINLSDIKAFLKNY